MRKTILIYSLIAASLLAGCGGNNSSEPPTSIEINDMIGRSVKVNPGSYKRVICIGAGALRLYSYIGDSSLLAGVEDIENESLTSRPKMFDGVARPYFIANKEIYKTLPSCGVGGPNAQAAEEEAILNCNPDIVFSEYEDATKEDALQEKLGVPVITLSYGSKGVFDDHLKTSIELLGKILAKEERAASLNKYIADSKEEISSLTKDVSQNKNVYICGLGNWGTTSHLYTAQNYEPFNVAHINNIVNGLAKDGIQAIEEEKFYSYADKIDVMIIDAAGVKNIKPKYQADPTMFDSLKAWKNKEVYLQMPYNAYYTNVEIALANTWYNAYVVYPELFADFDIDKKLSEITTEFLGKDLTSEIKSYQHSYGGYQKIDTDTFFK